MYVMISRNNCVYCDRAKALLREHRKGVVVYNIEEPSSKWVLSLLKIAGLTTVPQIFDNKGHHIGGYSDLAASLGLDQ